MQRTATFLFGLFLISTLALSGIAAEGGSETKGKFYFKKSCKTCHSTGGQGGEVTPLTKTQAQWKKYFDAGTHNKGKEKLQGIISADQLRDVETFLYNHASDSPQPETCGG